NGLIQSILDLVTGMERKAIKEFIGNELIHFQSITHNKPLLKMIWDICFTIRKQNMIEIRYEKMNGTESRRKIKPVSVIFSEFYYYLIAFIDGSEYESPAFFRLDRIVSFEILADRFVIPEKNRVEVGELRKRAQFMYAGELITLRFNYYGSSLSAVLDRLPTAEVVKQMDEGRLIEAEVYGKGC
ncbi:helix-turn-helix transcriptional regulator, partial [Paenibacillus sp. MCAF20]